MAVKRKDNETVVFSWITWPSRKVWEAPEDLAGDRRQPKGSVGEIGTLATLVSGELLY